MNRLQHERRVRINKEMADVALEESRKMEARLTETRRNITEMYKSKNKPWMVKSSTAKLNAIPARFAQERRTIEHKRRTLAYYSGIDPTEEELDAKEGRELRETLEEIKESQSRGCRRSVKRGGEDLVETMSFYDSMRETYGYNTSSSH